MEAGRVSERERRLHVFTTIAFMVIIISIIRFEWMVAIAEVIAVLYVYTPFKREHVVYHGSLTYSMTVPSFILLFLQLYDTYFVSWLHPIATVDAIWILELLLVSAITFATGFILAVLLNRSTKVWLTKRWMLISASVFSFAFSSVCMWMVGVNIWLSGLPFTNGQVLIHGTVTNNVLMAPPCCAAITIVFMTILMKKLIRDMAMTDFAEVMVDGEK